MTSTESRPVTAAAPSPFLVADRIGEGRWAGRNERGAAVAIGPEGADGVFSPGELLAIAAAACAGMSSESRIAAELGDDVPVSVGVSRVPAEGEHRYERLVVEIVVSGPAAGSQDPARQERMLATARRAVERYCTVSRTLEAGAHSALVLTVE